MNEDQVRPARGAIAQVNAYNLMFVGCAFAEQRYSRESLGRERCSKARSVLHNSQCLWVVRDAMTMLVRVDDLEVINC